MGPAAFSGLESYWSIGVLLSFGSAADLSLVAYYGSPSRGTSTTNERGSD